MNRFALILLNFVLIAASVFAEPSLHMILVCDTQAENVQEAVSADLRLVQSAMEQVAFLSKMELRPYILQGAGLSKKNLLKILHKKVAVGKDDTIFFYFSGHGFRFEHDQSNFPNFFFTPQTEYIPYSQVIDLLLTKQPRLLIAVADCCNNQIESQTSGRTLCVTYPKNSSLLLLQEKNASELFKYAKGCVLVTSSRKGQYSRAINPLGGCYTLSFHSSLKQQIHSTLPVSWDYLLYQADKNIEKWKVEQRAEYTVNIEY